MAEPLRIRFAADTGPAKAAMQSLTSRIIANSITMAGSLKVVNDTAVKLAGVFGVLPTSFKAAAAGVASLLVLKAAIDGVEALAKAAAEQVERLAAIAKDSDRLGVSTGFLQSMQVQARGLGLEVEAVTKSLEKLKDVSIVKQGEGGADARNQSAIEARLIQQRDAGNIMPADVKNVTGAADNEERFKRLLELMQRLIAEGRTLAALDIGSKFLDPSIVDRIRNSANELDRLIIAAETLKSSQIFSEDEVRRGEELNKRMENAQRILDTGLKPLYEELARLGTNFHESNVVWVEFLARHVPKIVSLVEGLVQAIDAATRFNPMTMVPAAMIRQMVKDPGASTDVPPAGPTGDILRVKVPFPPRRPGSADNTNAIRTDATAGAADSKDEIERLIDQLGKANEVAKAELETVGLGNIEREKALGLAKLTAAAKAAGRDATDEETESVKRLAEATGELKARTMDQQQALRENAEAMRAFGQAGADAFADVVLEGKSFDDVLSNLSRTLSRYAIQAAFTGQGCMGGIGGVSRPAININIEGVTDECGEHHARDGGDPALDRRRVLSRGRDGRIVRRQGHPAPSPQLRDGRESA